MTFNMKLLVLSAMLCSTFVVAFGAAVEQSPAHSKEEEAIAYCNSSIPVTEDTRQKLTKIVINGKTIPKNLNDKEWCNLHCVLEKVGFFDAEGNMQVRRILKYILKTHPELASQSDHILVYLFQISRSIKSMEDKCMKAFVAYYRFTETIMVSTLVSDLNAKPEVKEKVIEAVLNEDILPKELEASAEKYFKNVELFYKKTIENNADISSTSAPTPGA